jgi:hypothetical protein
MFASPKAYFQGDIRQPLSASPPTVRQAEFDRFSKAPRVAPRTDIGLKCLKRRRKKRTSTTVAIINSKSSV